SKRGEVQACSARVIVRDATPVIVGAEHNPARPYWPTAGSKNCPMAAARLPTKSQIGANSRPKPL
ncbi:MAG: hypothetical protein ACXWUH_16320, partial [Burkholderiales bacterium]